MALEGNEWNELKRLSVILHCIELAKNIYNLVLLERLHLVKGALLDFGL
jgi:hypothetical protein